MNNLLHCGASDIDGHSLPQKCGTAAFHMSHKCRTFERSMHMMMMMMV